MNNSSTIHHKLIFHESITWAVAFSIVTCAIICSNVLALIVFVRTRLQRVRKRTHYLLISLTCADLFVGCLSSPLFIWDLTHPLQHQEVILHKAIHEVIDIISGFASILSLAAIAFERFVAVRWPLKHRSATTFFYVIAIATPWLIAVLIAVLYVLGFVLSIIPSHTMSIITVLCITSALAIIALSYTLIKQRVMRAHWQPQTPITERERKLTQILMKITFVSLLTWLPFEVLLIVVHFCSMCREPFVKKLSSVNLTFKLLQLSNSFLNTLFYTLRIPEYKRALHQLFNQPCLREMALPVDKSNSAKLTSIKKIIRSPLLARNQAGAVLAIDYAIRSVGQVPGNIVTCSSPLMSRKLTYERKLSPQFRFGQ